MFARWIFFGTFYEEKTKLIYKNPIKQCTIVDTNNYMICKLKTIKLICIIIINNSHWQFLFHCIMSGMKFKVKVTCCLLSG